ncbi:hypothetical protein J6590_004260 [Homalodisca vitripennis]|nr:hypothetical protein J6590_004260 [Homalodisca vitripennis]
MREWRSEPCGTPDTAVPAPRFRVMFYKLTTIYFMTRTDIYFLSRKSVGMVKDTILDFGGQIRIPQVRKGVMGKSVTMYKGKDVMLRSGYREIELGSEAGNSTSDLS